MELQKKGQFLGHNAAVYAICAFKKQDHFLSTGGDGWIVEWDLNRPETGRLLAKTDANIFSMLYLDQKNWVVAGNMYGGLHWIDLNNAVNFKSVLHHKKGVFALALFNENGDEITDEWNIPCVLQGDCIPEQANVQRQHRFMERCQCY